jgi:ankyrin repeat protein
MKFTNFPIETIVHISEYMWKFPLHESAKNGWIEMIQMYFRYGMNIHQLDSGGCTPLFIAALYNRADIVRYLAGLGADVDLQTITENRILCIVTSLGYLDVVRCLVQYGADPNKVDQNGDTPLHIASANGHLDIVKYLVEQKVCLDMRNTSDYTPFDYAVRYQDMKTITFLIENTEINASSLFQGFMYNLFHKGNLEVITYLVRKGFVIDLTDYTYLLAAVESDSIPTVQYLLNQGMDIHNPDMNENNVIHTASGRGLLNMVMFLVGNGANIHSKGRNGSTPLYEAVSNCHFPVIQYLVEQGADVSAKDDLSGSTLLHLTSSYGDDSITRYLLKHDVDILCKNAMDQTALSNAVSQGHVDVVLTLIDHGADVHHNNLGTTLLHIAAQKGYEVIISILIDSGISLLEVNGLGNSALHLAVENEHLDAVCILLTQKDIPVSKPNLLGNTPLHIACAKGNLSIVKLLLKCGSDICAVNQFCGYMPLHFAVLHRHVHIVKCLVEFINDDTNDKFLNHVNNVGQTALTIAILSKNLGMVQYLVEKKVDLTMKDKQGNTPLHIAVTHSTISIVYHLVEQGADLHAKNDEGITPFISTFFGSKDKLDIIEYLINQGSKTHMVDEYGNPTIVRAAAMKVCLEVMVCLVEQGADVNATGINGFTPLINAIASGSDVNVIEYLLKCGADVHAVDDDGSNALHTLLSIDNERNYDEASVLRIVQKLVEYGLDIHTKDGNGHDALQLASICHYFDVVQYIIRI